MQLLFFSGIVSFLLFMAVRRGRSKAEPVINKEDRFHVFYAWERESRRVLYVAGEKPGISLESLPSWATCQPRRWSRVTSDGYLTVQGARLAAHIRQADHGKCVNGKEYLVTDPTPIFGIESLVVDFVAPEYVTPECATVSA